jgi:RNA ligase-like protein
MSPTEYVKINTVFARDARGKIVESQLATPAFEYLRGTQWEFTEKVDGTNVRLHYDGSPTFRGNEHAYVYGRTDRAQLPPALLRRLVDVLRAAPLEDTFGVGPDVDVTLYGEGYGQNIQSAGRHYLADRVDFVLFDVKVDRWWLSRDSVADVGTKLGFEIVPVLGRGTLDDMVAYARTGFQSTRWSGVTAEGIVARPTVDLFDRAGQRIVAKIKYRDFR